MTQKIVPVILAGGLGTRLWPMSRAARPKQFLPLIGAESLYQQTLARVGDPDVYEAPVVITNNDFRFLVAEQAALSCVALDAVLLEPASRNTAPAIAAAAAYVAGRFGADAVMHVLPSDHAVIVDDGYRQSVQRAADAVRSGHHVTFGIVPTTPETGYGYIEAGAELSQGVALVKRFVEKPDRARAQELIAAGGFLWNSGMFMIGAGAFLEECAALAPDVHAAAAESVENAVPDLDFVRLEASAFERSPSISVDYAIFERTSRAAVLPVSFEWSDLGAWDAVWKISGKDDAGNATTGPVTLSNTRGSLVVSDKAHVVAEGLEDVAIVASEDAIYVGKLSEAQKVGDVVKRLRGQGGEVAELTEIHRTAYRPWGGYSSVLQGERFQVKRLFVKPGKKLSLQKHHHRSEHWIVVRGTAEVTVDDTVPVLTENQSIYLPLGCTHRLSNPVKILLELIEVQTGSYLGEDDIIRIEDEFGRA